MSNFLEIGPGRGDFLFRLAEENPLKTVQAIEYKRKRYEKLSRRLEKRELSNIRLHFGDARVVLPQEFRDESLEKVFILFPDPWPKRRHEKHRLFQDSFIKELLRVLKPEGEILIATDDPLYRQRIQEVFRHYIHSFVFSPLETLPMTFYADKWRREGRELYSFSYGKIGCRRERDSLSLPCAYPTFKTDRDLSES